MFFLIGIFIHITFLSSIFDIYFKSPVVNNVPIHKPIHDAVADRLVLFIVDGLRAESFVNYSTLSYIRSVANSEGKWGISHTRVPTESRPGHVAVLAGFYEDPSAVAKGWKENPVDFDSVLNEAKYSWCWGTYDIVGIFTKGHVGDHIFSKTFDPYDESFSSNKNTSLLDAWVFEEVENFFKDSNQIYGLLHQKKIMFFLHLLGSDTAGHTHKPKTENFLTTLRHVDEGIQRTEKIIKDFYGDDGKTTFLVTSDHGMTDWGSHGAGDDHETQTPYIIWGAGVKKSTLSQPDTETIGMSRDHRLDIEQADLAPLMATILSVPVPVNSIGRVNTDLINTTLENKAKAIYSNSRQLANQYNKKRQDVEAYALSYLYQPFETIKDLSIEEEIKIIESLIQQENYMEVIEHSNKIIDRSIAGLQYYHNYYQRPLLILVTFAFIGWIFYLLTMLLEQTINTQNEQSSLKSTKGKSVLDMIINIIFLVLMLLMPLLIFVQNLPLQYNVYALMPVLLWYYVLREHRIWTKMISIILKRNKFCQVGVEFTCYVLGSFAMGLSFTYRWMLSIPLLGMGLWPFFSSKRNNLSIPLLISWAVGCLSLSVFSFIPVVGKDVFIELVIIAGAVWIVALSIYMKKVLFASHNEDKENKTEIILTMVQMALFIISLHNVYTQSKRFENKEPISKAYQTFSWFVAIVTPIVPLGHSTVIVNRIMAVSTAILNFYLLLSVAHEGLFMVALIFNTACWIYLEFKMSHNKQAQIMNYNFNEFNKELISHERSLGGQDFRRAFFFTLYIILAFFGTGNIASLNSFEVRWVTCFITSFNPFLITGLILLKTLSPFLCVACSFRAVQHLTKAPIGFLNVIVLIYSNLMGIQLLYNVKNTGSWLEIGTSISQYVIVQVITLFIVIIHQMAKVLTDVRLHNFVNKLSMNKEKNV